MTPTKNAKRARRATLGGRVEAGWSKRDKPGLMSRVGPAEVVPWKSLSRDEALARVERLREGWEATTNPALLVWAVEGCEVHGFFPAWLGPAVRGVLLVGFGEIPVVRAGAGGPRPTTLPAVWRRHRQDVIDYERFASVNELRDRFDCTWNEAAGIVACEWLGVFVGPEAVKASCRRVRREIRAGREARYGWTPADERFLRTLKADRRHAASWVNANEKLTRVLARRGKTRDDF